MRTVQYFLDGHEQEEDAQKWDIGMGTMVESSVQHIARHLHYSGRCLEESYWPLDITLIFPTGERRSFRVEREAVPEFKVHERK